MQENQKSMIHRVSPESKKHCMCSNWTGPSIWRTCVSLKTDMVRKLHKRIYGRADCQEMYACSIWRSLAPVLLITMEKVVLADVSRMGHHACPCSAHGMGHNVLCIQRSLFVMASHIICIQHVRLLGLLLVSCIRQHTCVCVVRGRGHSILCIPCSRLVRDSLPHLCIWA